jgi:hypothetical protein
LLRAKLHELPTLTVEILRRGAQCSSPYAGNGPSVVWDGNPAAVASRAMVEWRRAAFFRLEAKRICTAAGLPSCFGEAEWRLTSATNWEVRDASATNSSARVYSRLAGGAT